MEKGSQGVDILRLDRSLQRELSGEFSHKLLVAVRLRAAQAVIEVQNEGHDSQAGSKLHQGAQQSHRICAAAYGDTNALARTNQTMLAYVKVE
jgi:hypothetical protein